jgi:hypothetical protein
MGLLLFSQGSQEKTGSRSKTSSNDETKPYMEKGLEEVAVEKNKCSEAKIETRTDAETSSRRPPNQTVRFLKLDHLVLAASGQRRTSRTITPWTALAPH